MRYKIYKGSLSKHCCFEYTILNTEEYEMSNGKKWFANVCETFTKEGAELICGQLNNGYLDYVDYYFEEGENDEH